MTNKQDAIQPQGSTISFVHRGMGLGSKAGFGLSLLYAIFGIFLVFLLEALREGVGFSDLQASGVFESYRLTHAVPLFLVTVLLILFVAVAPATILGILTGMLLGKFVEIFIGRLSKYVLIISCAILCMIVAILIHLFFDIAVVFSFQPAPIAEANHFSMGVFESYPFYMGIPTILYVLAGGWTGWQLYLKSFIQIDEKN